MAPAKVLIRPILFLLVVAGAAMSACTNDGAAPIAVDAAVYGRDVTRWEVDARADGSRQGGDALFDAESLDHADASPNGDATPDTDGRAESLAERLARLPDLRVYSVTADKAHFAVRQPVDHGDPEGPTFEQHGVLVHVGDEYPMVLATTGYFLWDTTPEIAATFGANYIVLEHRHFGDSRPSPEAWNHLTIRQSAHDFARLRRLFATQYPAAWVLAGHSKGGMTALYTQRFFPAEFAGSVAYVAPSSHGLLDSRYAAFLQSVGTSSCRAALGAFQRRALARRQELAQIAAADGLGTGRLAADRIVEIAVIETEFALFQYGDGASCSRVPGSGTDAELYSFLSDVAWIQGYSDANLDAFDPYAYQACRELGGPAPNEAHLMDFLAYPGADTPCALLRPDVPVPAFDPFAMLDIESWFSASSTKAVLLYGGNDPWSAGAFPPSSSPFVHVYRVAEGNHNVLLADLPEPDKSDAFRHVGAMLGVQRRALAPKELSAIRRTIRPIGRTQR